MKNLNVVNKMLAACLLLVSVNLSTHADQVVHLNDPTRPLDVPQAKESKKEGKFVLQGIYRFEDGIFAIVNDKKVLLGDSIDSGMIKSLNSQRVLVEYEGNLLELTMKKSILKPNGKRP